MRRCSTFISEVGWFNGVGLRWKRSKGRLCGASRVVCLFLRNGAGVRFSRLEWGGCRF